jgi:hypothetical protein
MALCLLNYQEEEEENTNLVSGWTNTFEIWRWVVYMISQINNIPSVFLASLSICFFIMYFTYLFCDHILPYIT